MYMCIIAHLKVTERLSEATTGAVYCCSISHVCIVVLYGFDSCVGACHCSAAAILASSPYLHLAFVLQSESCLRSRCPRNLGWKTTPPSAPVRVDQMAPGWTKQRCAAIS